MLLLFGFLVSASVLAQASKDTLIRGVTADFPMLETMTIQQVKDKVLEKVKEEALRKAGIAESLTSTKTFVQTEGGNRYIDYFSNLVQIELSGAVLRCENVQFSTFEDYSLKVTKQKVVADITVRRYTSKKDPAFEWYVEGIKSVYQSGEQLEFTVKPGHKGYMHVFSISNKEASLLYPIWGVHYSSKDTLIPFSKGLVYRAPFSSMVDYTLDAENDGEAQLLLIVATKKSIHFPFTKLDRFGNVTETHPNQVFEWVSSLEPHERFLFSKGFVVRK